MVETLKKFVNKYFFVLLLVILLIIRIPTFLWPLDNDFSIYLQGAKILNLNGQIYKDVWDQKAPMIFLIYRFFALFSSNYIYFKIVFALISFVNVTLFYKLTKKLFKYIDIDNLYFTKLSTILYIIYSNLPSVANFGGYTELFGSTILLSIYLLLTIKLNIKKSFIVGVLISSLFYLKINYLLLLVPIFAYKYLDLSTLKKKYLELSIIILSTIMSIFALYYLFNPSSFNDFWIASVLYNSKYTYLGWIGEIMGNSTWYVRFSTFIIALGGILGVIYAYKNFNINYKKYLLLLSIIPFVYLIMTGIMYAYYLLIITPFLAIFTTFFIIDNKKISYVKTTVIIFILVLGSFLCNKYQGGGGSFNISILDIYNNNKISSKTLFLTYFGANGYELDGRLSSTKFISTLPACIDKIYNFGFGLGDDLLDEINKKKYDQIIVQDKSICKQYFDKFVNENNIYENIYSNDKFIIYSLK